VKNIGEVEFGEQLPVFEPDTSIENVRVFGKASGWNSPRFTDHEHAKKEGFPGALVPGIMSQGFLAAMIHRWAPEAQIENVDTIFRAPVIVDVVHSINGVVTDIDEDAGLVEIDLTLSNAANETRVLGTARVRLPSV
jgi:acyl dehydratase